MFKALAPLTKDVLCFNGLEKFFEDLSDLDIAAFEELEKNMREELGFHLLSSDFSRFSDNRSLPYPRRDSLYNQRFNVERKMDGSNFVLARGQALG